MKNSAPKLLRRIRAIGVACALLVLWAPVVQAVSEAALESREGQTRVRFLGALLEDLEIEIREMDATSESPGTHRFAMVPGASLDFSAPGGAFRDMVGGAARHAGGFVLERRGHRLDLRDFVLRPGAEELTLEILDAEGEVALVADHLHSHLDTTRGILELRNADLELSVRAAAKLGEPRLAGMAIAQFEHESRFVPPREIVPAGSCSSPNYALPQDVALVDIPDLQAMRREEGKVVVSLAAKLLNVGSGDVEWCEAFEPRAECQDTDRHPLLIWGLYRSSGGGFEQVGKSFVKHAFYSINSDCACGGGHVLWSGCGDTYSRTNNDDLYYLAPRGEIEANDAEWSRCSGYFDSDCDGEREHPTPQEESTELYRNRMLVDETDLQTPGAEYFIEAWYLVHGDTDIFNTMGWRRVVPVFDDFWTFTLATPLTNGSVIDAWVASTRGEGVSDRARVDTGEGHFTVAVRVNPTGEGASHRYLYAVQNHDYDAALASFEVPIPAGVAVSDAVFTDADDDADNDWTVEIGPNQVTFSAPEGNELDWGTLYRFGMTVDGAPTAGQARLQNAAAEDFVVDLLAPSSMIFADNFDGGNADGWSQQQPPVAPTRERGQ